MSRLLEDLSKKERLQCVCVHCGKDFLYYPQSIRVIAGIPICKVCYTGIEYVINKIKELKESEKRNEIDL